MEEDFKSVLEMLQHILLSWQEHKNDFPHYPVATVTKTDKKCFQSLLCFVKQTNLTSWSDSQDEFIVLSCHENDDFDIVNILSVLSALAHKKGDTACLEEVQSLAVMYQQHPGAGFLMNNLGVMFSEYVLYEKSKECFDIAKKCFKGQQDNLRNAVVTLNLAVVHRALGNCHEAQVLCCDAASLCRDISMRTTKEACLPAKLLRRIADMLEEFGNYKILENMEVDPPVSIPHDNCHADVDVCLCLLSCLLSQARPASPEETDFARCDRGTKQLKDSCQLQTAITDVNVEERSCLAIDHKGGVQGICTSERELLLTKWPEDLHDYQNQQQEVSVEFPQSIPGRSNGKEKIDVRTLTDDCFKPLLANLEDKLSAIQKERLELQQRVSQLEEQLKQSEKEKQNLQADLGKYQFFEDKEKRRGRSLGRTASMQDPADLGKYQLLEGKERLLGRAAAVQDPGFSLRARLLEISTSLSAEEVKQIKFLAKSKVNGFRLARFTEAFELFEELEMSGEFSCDYIGKLLAGIQRYDLAEKLGMHVSLLEAERGSNHPPGQSMPERKPDLPDHASNSAKSMATQDNSIDVPPDRCDRERHLSDGGNKNDCLSRTEETDYDCNKYASISSSGSSDENHHYTTEEQLNSSDMAVSRINVESNSSSLQSAINATKSNQLSNSSDNDFLSDSSCSTTVSSSNLSVNSTHSPQAAVLNSTIQTSSYSTDGSPMLTSVNSHSAFGRDEISSDSGLTPTSSGEENLRSSQMLANGDEDSEGRGVCNGAIRTAPSCISACAVGAGTNSSDSSACGFVRTQSGANVGNVPWSQQGAFPSAGMASGAFKDTATDWERLGARPKQGRAQHSVIKKMPGEPFIPISDGLAGDFLARHTQDKALHDSLYLGVGSETPLFNDTAPQGASYIDGVINVSDSNRAKPYIGDCHPASGTDRCSRLGVLSGQFDGRGIFYSEHLNNNTGPLPNHLGGNYFSVYGNYSQRNTLNATNGPSLQSGFVHNNSRFSDHFGGVPHLPLETQQGPNPSVPSNQVLNSGVTGSGFADPTGNGSAVGHPGHTVYGAQRHTFFNNNTSTLTSAQSMRQTPHNRNLALGNHSNSTTNSDNVPIASAKNIPHGDVQNSALSASHAVSSCDPTCTTGLELTTTSWPSLVCHSSNTTTVGGDILAQESASGTSIPEPSCGNADNRRASGLNNKHFNTDSVESTGNSLLALEQRVAEACALVERVLREREECEQFGREIEQKEQLIREQRARERREREETEIREAERCPQQQEAVTARSQWLCEHYQWHCRVRFPCCTQFYPCHHCHNISKACDNEEAKACHASHLKCSHCQHEQEIGEGSEKCSVCDRNMGAYFCSICEHLISADNNPYHCEKCGICRIHKDRSFHCDVCNVCLDKPLQGNHQCRPDSGHDECCFCLEDTFSGCQILPCSHKVHRECGIAMIQYGIRTCPICGQPLRTE